jgi:5-formyltetrahydrofolate cyclo-ligase
MVVPPTSETKVELRKEFRKLRQEFVSKRNLVAFSAECPPFAQFTLYIRSQRCVAGYLAMGSECDVTPLLETASEMGCALALPHISDRDGQIVFRDWRIGAPLENAAFGFRQPLANSPAAEPDIILTPLVAFDRALNRLGQGAGHYDRAFASHPDALRIGVAWSVQEASHIPAEPWDMPLDAVLTEREWIASPTGRLREDTQP